MFCPRCGHENADGSRYCSSCGANLRKPAARARAPVRERLAALYGRSRRERLITLATIAVVAAAVAAFLALRTDEEPLASPEGVELADRECLRAKRAVAEASARAAGGGVQSYAEGVVEAMLVFREGVRDLQLEGPEATALDRAIRDTAIEAGGLARVARRGSPATQTRAQAEELDRTSGELDEAIGDLGLVRCAVARVVPIAPAGSDRGGPPGG